MDPEPPLPDLSLLSSALLIGRWQYVLDTLLPLSHSIRANRSSLPANTKSRLHYLLAKAYMLKGGHFSSAYLVSDKTIKRTWQEAKNMTVQAWKETNEALFWKGEGEGEEIVALRLEIVVTFAAEEVEDAVKDAEALRRKLGWPEISLFGL